MKWFSFLTFLVVTSGLVAEEKKEPTIEQISETLGHYIGKNLIHAQYGLQLSVDSVIKGMRDGADGKAPPLTESEYEEAIINLQEAAMEKQSAKNLQEASDFLKKNRNESGIIELVPERLQYTVLQEGTGAPVTNESTPSILYTGKLIDGTVFGTSDESGPLSIPLDQTIPGFSKGLQGMKEGEKRRLFIHPEYAYGTSGELPPNSLLIFDVEVVKADDEGDGDGDDDNDDDSDA